MPLGSVVLKVKVEENQGGKSRFQGAQAHRVHPGRSPRRVAGRTMSRPPEVVQRLEVEDIYGA